MLPTGPIPRLDTQAILALRPDIGRPEPGFSALNVLEELEASNANGDIKKVLTVLLRGSECQFRCLMCDLWKHTHKSPTPPGAIATQTLASVRASLPAQWIKLYNASNFFAPANVPQVDLEALPDILSGFEKVIVENHPKLLGPRVQAFRDALPSRLEIAMGLETIHPEVLPLLNKRMNITDFRRACDWLLKREIDVRTFVLLRPPGMSENEGVEWCIQSVQFAIDCGSRHVSVIPVRSGNGAIEHLQQLGHFQSPLASSLETVLNHFASQTSSVVTADLWDWPKLRGTCDGCSSERLARLQNYNLMQKPFVPFTCNCAS